jgi:hypothetical protein
MSRVSDGVVSTHLHVGDQLYVLHRKGKQLCALRSSHLVFMASAHEGQSHRWPMGQHRSLEGLAHFTRAHAAVYDSVIPPRVAWPGRPGCAVVQ